MVELSVNEITRPETRICLAFRPLRAAILAAVSQVVPPGALDWRQDVCRCAAHRQAARSSRQGCLPTLKYVSVCGLVAFLADAMQTYCRRLLGCRTRPDVSHADRRIDRAPGEGSRIFLACCRHLAGVCFTGASSWRSNVLPASRRVCVQRREQDRGRSAGFIPQEREYRTEAPAKFQSLLRLPRPMRTEVRAPFARAATTLITYGHPAFSGRGPLPVGRVPPPGIRV